VAQEKKGSVGFVIAGAIVAVVAAVVAAAGGVGIWADQAKRSGDGYFMAGSHRYAADTRAIATDQVTIGAHAPKWLIGKARLEIGSAGKPVFVGIARKRDVDAYLAGVSHTLATDLDPRPFHVTYVARPGTAAPGRPADQPFWAATTSGTGPQSLTWKVRSGTWSIVLMNADGSPGVAADIGVGVDLPWLLWLSVGAAGIGALLLALGAALIALGLRGRETAPSVPAATAA
jgi:hypothetical protein